MTESANQGAVHAQEFPLGGQAGATNVAALFAQRARMQPGSIALIEGDQRMTFAALDERVNRLANVLLQRGLKRGDRVALLSRNCTAYVEIELAAATLGVMVAALNWRLAQPELIHCIELAAPALVIVSEDYHQTLSRLDIPLPGVIVLGHEYQSLLARASAAPVTAQVNSEDGLVIVYTSGTTGLPKGAVVSHRAMIARALVFATDFVLRPQGAFIAWAPFFHMASTDHALATLLRGGPVVIIDGYDKEALYHCVEQFTIGWLPLIPGMLDDFLSLLKSRPPKVKGIQVIGAMPDLVSPQHISEITGLLHARYANTFGATETGLPPATASFFEIGETPSDLAKVQSSFCEIRLVDEDDREVGIGEPGECAIRGPTLFSGYWRAPDTNAHDFRGGWFHMGDVFMRRDDGRLAFMDRSKYMIKSGGENVYPAEIERVLLADDRVDDAVVVRRTDERWGEVAVAAVARNDESLSEESLTQRCREQLAGYKLPREIKFVAFDDLPRSTTGKIKRHEVEAWFAASNK